MHSLWFLLSDAFCVFTGPQTRLNMRYKAAELLIIESTWSFHSVIHDLLSLQRFFEKRAWLSPHRTLWWSEKSSRKLQKNSKDCVGTWIFPVDVFGRETRITVHFIYFFWGLPLSKQLATSKCKTNRAEMDCVLPDRISLWSSFF